MIGRLRSRFGDSQEPALSFGSWDQLEGPTVVVCHPEWRGVRVAAYSHPVPVIEVADAARNAEQIVGALRERPVETIVVQGFPPGSGELLARATAAGFATRCVIHSSMAQHGGEVHEAAVVDEVVRLLHAGTLGGIGFVKEGQAEAFTALGHPASYVPNRIPRLPRFDKLDLGEGLNVGVFAEPFWRKNVNTQLGAVALLGDARAHVMRRPEAGYLQSLETVEHGELPWDHFVQLQGSVDLNLYVTLSECFPMTPLESYSAGVPCLTSRTSAVFRSDAELWGLTTVDEADNPSAITAAATRLLSTSEEATERAHRWMEGWDAEAAQRWEEFVAGPE
jgi:glycosyltransferase involved in cell wall biosynthesis